MALGGWREGLSSGSSEDCHEIELLLQDLLQADAKSCKALEGYVKVLFHIGFYFTLLRVISKVETSDFSISETTLWLLNREWGRESLIAVSSIRVRVDGAWRWREVVQRYCILHVGLSNGFDIGIQEKVVLTISFLPRAR